MTSIIYFLPDVNDEVDRRQGYEDFWDFEPGPDYVPSTFIRLVSDGVEPEVAADLMADDGLPVCDEPPDVADDEELVIIWSGMYEAVA